MNLVICYIFMWLTQWEEIRTLWTKIYATFPKKKYANNKIDVNYIDVTWKMDLLDLNDYVSKKDVVVLS